MYIHECSVTSFTWAYKQSLLSQEKALGSVLCYNVLVSAVLVAVSVGLQATVSTRPQLCECLLRSHSNVSEKKDKIVC